MSNRNSNIHHTCRQLYPPSCTYPLPHYVAEIPRACDIEDSSWHTSAQFSMISGSSELVKAPLHDAPVIVRLSLGPQQIAFGPCIYPPFP